MLTITIPEKEFFDETRSKFVKVKETKLQLEHSLLSVSKWESKWHVPYISKKEKTEEQILDYIKCMTITQNVDPNVYLALTNENIDQVVDYIKDPMTATWISNKKDQQQNKEAITAELIYYWMIAQNIPFSCEKWHLNKLLMLIEVCVVKNTPPKKMTAKQTMSRNKALNEARRAQLHSKG